jgi:hypothetical protein
MKVTPKKLKANRENAKKSTGPKSPEGKKKISQNAVKHGLYAKPLILNSPKIKDDYHEYNRLIFSLYDEHDPQGMHEENYVREIANCIWRARRAIWAENAQISRQLNSVDDYIETRLAFIKQLQNDDSDDAISPEEMERYHREQIGMSCMPNKATADAIIRFERHLDIKKTRALKSLLILQKNRRAHPHKETSLQPYIPELQTQTPTNPLSENQIPHSAPSPDHLQDGQKQVSACGRQTSSSAPALDQLRDSINQAPPAPSVQDPEAEKALIEKLFAENQIIEDDPPPRQKKKKPLRYGTLKKQSQTGGNARPNN